MRINDIRVKLFPPDQYEKFTTLEIRPYEKFNSKEESIILYLNSIPQNDTNFSIKASQKTTKNSKKH